ncbi:MAG: NADH dehydrogenase (quinone) subunit D [bacterium]
MILNFGPHHPATHGVLRLLLWVDSEYMHKAQVHLGYLHRGFEKLAENRTYEQFIPMVDRLDYLSGLCNSYSLVLAIEKLFGITPPKRADYIRVIMMELQRLSTHVFWVAAFAIDLGAITPMFYCFREREVILDFMEMVAGGRMTFNFHRVGGVKQDLPEGFKDKLLHFLQNDFKQKIEDYDTLLRGNRIILHRCRGVGIIPKDEAINCGLTGPNLRGSGVKWDIRKEDPYSVYDELDFDVPVGEKGDVYDRYLVRLEEMRQSARILEQALKKIPDGPIMTDDPRVRRPDKEHVMDNPESLIRYCHVINEGIRPPVGEVYSRIEGPRGEFGYYLVSNGASSPYRAFIRVPTTVSLTTTDRICRGRLIGDLAAILGGFDVVLGETDK